MSYSVGFIYIAVAKIDQFKGGNNLPKTIESMVTCNQVLEQNSIIVAAYSVGCPLSHGGQETEDKEGVAMPSLTHFLHADHTSQSFNYLPK